ncbi:hypothetical protein [Maricaulis sp.]|uniref:hypothetical protein n=1 Tax=Maricaulis sp. TaxID=1486257 RepID=UPI003A8E7EFE
MNSGLLIYLLALAPALLLLRSLQVLRRCVNDIRFRRRALVQLPILILAAPFVITLIMSGESQLDSGFILRTFSTVAPVGMKDLFLFAIDQTGRGALLDFMEVFGIRASPLVHSCNSILFCISMLIYRTAIGLAISVLALSVGLEVHRGWRAWRQLDR